MPKLLIIDNYDSFTYTIQNYFLHLGAMVDVIKNDDDYLLDLSHLHYTHVVLSPGPGGPDETGHTYKFIKAHYQHLPILGICLGHQAIAKIFGGVVTYAPKVMHGKLSEIYHTNQGLFHSIKSSCFKVTRYHSLVVDEDSLPTDFEIHAWSYDDNKKVIMAYKHKNLPLYGIQYHPEAILTEHGYTIFQNFLQV
jgi:anthranilate synthase/aminodeoxychorismate synthase-like glutamine amidotransferase